MGHNICETYLDGNGAYFGMALMQSRQAFANLFVERMDQETAVSDIALKCGFLTNGLTFSVCPLRAVIDTVRGPTGWSYSLDVVWFYTTN